MPRRAPKLSQAILMQNQNTIQYFDISNFVELQRVVGRSLLNDEREALRGAARTYLLARVIETNSPTVAAIRKHILRVRKAAGGLREALTQTDDNSSGFFANRVISERLRGQVLFSRRITGQLDATAVALLMRGLERACEEAARSSLQSNPPLTPSWNKLIDDLSAWAKMVGLSTANSKRLQGKYGKLQLSPFAGFVDALQDQFPKEFRQHVTPDALAWAVSKALRELKRPQR